TDAGPVMATAGRAIDDRKPLFTLFVSPARRLADWQWIGWNPLGPYQASRHEAERLLGWHFNTGDPQSPTRFADAAGYRAVYETPGLLEHLYENETLPERAPPPLPSMSLA